MATLYFRVSAEYDKVVRLRDEIENLKRSLQGMDSTQSPEAFETMNRQLKAATDEMNELLTVAARAWGEMELKIEDSSKRIAEFTDKLLEAQSRLTDTTGQAAGGQGGQDDGTETVRAQAKAYEELKKEIDDYTGTIDRNSYTIVNLKARIKEYQDEVKRLEKGPDTTESRQAIAGLNKEIETLKLSVAEARSSMTKGLKLEMAPPDSIDALSQSLSRMKDAYKQLTEEERNGEFGQTLLASIQQADTKIKELTASMGEHQRNVGNYPSVFQMADESIHSFLGQVSSLPGPLGAAASGLQGLTKASLAFIATPIGAVLAAIAAALAAVYTWFNRTEEGENALAVTTATFDGVLQSVLDVVGDLGEWLYNCFANPKKALDDLVTFIKDQLMARLEAVGKMAQGVWKIMKGDFSGFNDITTSVTQFATGIRDLDEKMDEITRKARARAELQQRQNELDKKDRAWLVEKSELEAKLKKLQESRYDSAVSTAKKLSDMKEAEKVQAEITQKSLDLEKERLDIMEGVAKLSDTDKKTKKEIAEQQSKINKLEAEGSTAQRSLKRQERMLTSNANTERKQYDKLKKLEDDQALQRQRQVEDLEAQVAQSRINAMKNGTEKTLAQMELDHRKELTQLERQKEDYLRKYVEQERQRFEANPANKGRSFDASKVVLPNVDEEFAQMTEDLESKYEETTAKFWKAEADKASEYLRQYGTYHEKRAAIAALYDSKIADATSDIAKRTLEKQREAAIKALDFSQMQKSLNWEQVFGDLGTATESVLESLQKKLQSILDNERAKPLGEQMTPENLKVITEALDKIKEERISRDPFKSLKQSLAQYKKSLEESKKAQDELNAAQTADGRNALEEYAAAQDEIVKSKLREKEVTVEITDEEGNVITKTVKFGKLLDDAERKSREVSTNLKKWGDSVIASGRRITDMAGALGSVTDALGEVGVSLPEGIGKAIDGIDQAGQAMEAFDVTKPGSFLNLSNYVNLISGIGKTVAGVFTGIGDLIFGGKNKEYDDLMEKYSGVLDVWDSLIDKKTEYISESWGTEAVAAKEEALSLVNAETDVQRELARSRLKYGASWRSHSVGYNMWRGKDDYGYEGQTWQNVASDISRLTGTSFTGMDSLASMSAEQLEKVKESYAGLWAHMDEDYRNALESIIEYGETAQDVVDAINEQLTQVSFDSLYDSFMDNLMDMEKSSEDFADDFSEYMMKSFLAQQIGTKYNDRLKAWYESWAKDLEDGALSEGEIERMRSEYSQLVDEAIAERDRIAAITGYDTTSSTQEASSKAFASMSEDTGEELNGRFTALQESNESIKNEVSVISMSVSEIVGLQSEQKGLLNGCLDMMARQLLAQEAIRENTEAIIKPIQDIKKDISQIKSNTSRL